MSRAAQFAQAALALCVTGIVSVLLGAVLGLQGSSPAAAPPDRVTVEQAPDQLPQPTPAKARQAPKPAKVRTVMLVPGDTLYELAQHHRTTVKVLQRLNDLGTSTLIYAGKTLRVPTGPNSPDSARQPKAAPPTPAAAPDVKPITPSAKPPVEPAAKPAPSTVIAYARAQLGKPYVWGGTGPRGFDCSGLVMRAWQQAGVKLPRTTWGQVGAGTPTTRGKLVPGDLVISYGGGHVQLYIGDGKVIHAPRSGRTVTVAPLTDPSDVLSYRHITA
ncbi:NlpC/P60 family protein [Streptomyces bluensis]|uniref:C40 family peptidase n=1 Tax=Streptomyces bluensis TaxID=33897 RepID=UPI00332C48B2